MKKGIYMERPALTDEEIQKMFDEGKYNELFEWASDHENDSSKEVLKKVECIYLTLMQTGNGWAANNVGSMYYEGRGIKENKKLAASCFEIACKAGIQLTYCNLGYCYYYGGGNIEVDYEKAYRAFSEGVLFFNDCNCLYKLGDMYRYGYHVEKDEVRAFCLYLRAQEAGEKAEDEYSKYCVGNAYSRIGECLLYGIGTESNCLAALRNLNIALNILYERYNDYPYAKESVEHTKALVKDAEGILENFNHIKYTDAEIDKIRS